MGRAKSVLVSLIHVVLGFLCCGAGAAWMCVYFLYRTDYPGYSTRHPNGTQYTVPSKTNVTMQECYTGKLPNWTPLIMCVGIISGFFIMITGLYGLCSKTRCDYPGALACALNVLNLLIWTPGLTAGYTLLILTWLNSSLLPEDRETYNLHLLAGKDRWMWTFPAVGLTVGVLDFIVSLFHLVIHLCLTRTEKEEVYTSAKAVCAAVFAAVGAAVCATQMVVNFHRFSDTELALPF